MSYALRPHQEQAVEAAICHIKTGKGNGVIIAPTSYGKSLLPAAIAQRISEPVLVFQPSIELLTQNLEKMHAYGIMAGVFSASAGRKEVMPVTLATIGSAANKPELFKGYHTVIIDECHLAHGATSTRGSETGITMYKKFLSAIGNPKLIGMTATPFRLASNSFGSQNRFITRMKNSLWNEVIYVKQIGELNKEGYLCPLEYFYHKGIDTTQLVFNKAGSDYTEASIRAAMMGSEWEAKVINMIERLLRHGRKSILVFTPFVKDSERIASYLHGVAQVVHGEMPKAERTEAIAAFKEGRIPVTLNCNLLGIGFDHPALDTIIDASPTASLSRYYQRIGRGLRQHPSKKSTYVLDMCGNSKNFGKVEELEVRKNFKGHWAVMSNGRQLTNVSIQPQQVRQFARW